MIYLNKLLSIFFVLVLVTLATTLVPIPVDFRLSLSQHLFSGKKRRYMGNRLACKPPLHTTLMKKRVFSALISWSCEYNECQTANTRTS